jgi:hypothetical protein
MGGPKAPLSPQESVATMRQLIETFGPNQSGQVPLLRRSRTFMVNEARHVLNHARSAVTAL